MPPRRSADWTLVYDEAFGMTERSHGRRRVPRRGAQGRQIHCGRTRSQFTSTTTPGRGTFTSKGANPMLIDWETDDLRPADCLGPPLADVLYLVTYWYFQTSRAGSDSDEEAATVALFATPAPADRGVVAARMAIDSALAASGSSVASSPPSWPPSGRNEPSTPIDAVPVSACRWSRVDRDPMPISAPWQTRCRRCSPPMVGGRSRWVVTLNEPRL